MVKSGFTLSFPAIVIGIALIAFLPTIAFSAYLLLRYAASERELAEASLTQSARSIASAVDARFLAAEAALLVLRESNLLQEETLTDFETRLRGAAKETDLTFVLIDPAGQELINTAVSPTAPLGVSNRRIWDRVFIAGETVFSNVTRGPTTGRLLASVGVPVYRNDTVRWGLIAELFSEDFLPIINEPGMPSDWIVSIVDGTGVHLVRSHQNETFAGKPLVPTLVEQINRRGIDNVQTVSLEGIPLISTVQYAPKSGWAAAVGLPVASLEAPVNRSLRHLALIGLGAGGLALTLAFLVAHILNRAFAQLTTATALVGRGEAPTTPPTIVREINSIAQVLSTKSLEIQTLTADLERKVAERTESLSAAFTALQDEVEQRRETEAQLRQVQKLEAIGQLTGGIAHDFNNMLAVVLSALSLVKRRIGESNPEVKKYLDGARQAAEKAATLTSRLLAFSRQQALAPEPIDLHTMMSEWRETLRQTLPENIVVNVSLAEELRPVFADRHSLENVLLNLAVNARDAMPDGGTLTIEISNSTSAFADLGANQPPSGSYVRIDVSDTGNGIPPDALERVFEPFFTTKPPGQGTGLGLSQVHGFAKQSGGHVSIDSKIGVGTTISLFLPPAEQLPEKDTLATFDEPQDVCLNEVTILVVEDALDVRHMTVAMVKELGYLVLEASDAESALVEIESHPEIKVLLTDVVLPGLNGRQLAARACEMRPDLAVLFVTGYVKDHGRDEFDPDQLISKPFTLQTLAAKLRAAAGAVC